MASKVRRKVWQRWLRVRARLPGSDDEKRIVALAATDRRDAYDYECPATSQTVRLVRHVASTGKIRVLITNLLDPGAFTAQEFGDFYHQRWRIEEAFKRAPTQSRTRRWALAAGRDARLRREDRLRQPPVPRHGHSHARGGSAGYTAHQPGCRALDPETAVAGAAARCRHRCTPARRAAIDR